MLKRVGRLGLIFRQQQPGWREVEIVEVSLADDLAQGNRILIFQGVVYRAAFGKLDFWAVSEHSR